MASDLGLPRLDSNQEPTGFRLGRGTLSGYVRATWTLVLSQVSPCDTTDCPDSRSRVEPVRLSAQTGLEKSWRVECAVGRVVGPSRPACRCVHSLHMAPSRRSVAGMPRKPTGPACAKCGSTKDVAPYMLSAGAETVRLNLCEGCSEPVVELMELGESGPPARGGQRTVDRVAHHAVIPVD